MCGALEHPHPARVSDPVLARDITSAEELLAEAERELHAVETHVQQLTTSSGTRRRGQGAAGRTDLETAVADAAGQLEAATAAAGAHTSAVARLAAAGGVVDGLRAELAGVLAEAASLTGLLTELADQERAGVQRLATPSGAPQRVPLRLPDPAEHSRLGMALASHDAALSALCAARRRTEDAWADVERAVSSAGFPDAQRLARRCASPRTASASGPG